MRGSRRTVMLVAFALVVVMPLSAATGAIVDYVQVGVPGRVSTKGFAANLALVLSAPPQYERACCYDGSSGAWAGPPYRADGDPQRGGNSSIGWSVSFYRSSASSPALARKAVFLQAPVIASGKLAVAHVVSGRRVGSIKASYLVVGEVAPGARHQVAVVVPLSQKVKAVTLFDLSTPFSDSAGSYGQYTIDGVRPSVWNRKQALLLIRRVTLEGALPPSKIEVSRARSRIAGRVIDSYGHPVAEAPIKVLARRRGSWRVAQTASTTARGRFVFSDVRSGVYRLLVTLGGSKASRAVRVS